jgi:two-component system, cell cycle sensor histidine kinase and response regulator CckA
VIDALERIVDMNPSAVALLDVEPTAVLGHPVRRALEGHPELLEAIELHDEGTREVLVETPGGVRWYSVVSMPLGDAHSRFGSAHLFRDVTLQKRESVEARASLEREVQERQQVETQLGGQLRQAQKLESIGRLAGGIAHDFNNLLTSILGGAELARMRLPVDSEAVEPLEAIVEAARSAADITRQLLTFSRQQKGAFETVDLAALIARTERLLRRMIREDIRIELRIIEAPWPVRADASQVQQVLINLAVNAQDAMPTGGRLHVVVQNSMLDEADAATIPNGRPGPYVRVSVEDHGIGMSPDVLGDIFEPFFTTKPEGKGTGLGLAVVHGVVHQHGGFIRVDSTLGKGTTFSLFFPRDEAPARSVEPASFKSERLRRRANIVVVEDQEPVRRLVHFVLEQDGHRVRSFAVARELLDLPPDSEPPPDLLLTDVVLPEMSGAALADAVTRRWPNVKVVFMSGYAPEDVMAEGSVPAERFLGKPFSPEELSRCVEEALGGENIAEAARG